MKWLFRPTNLILAAGTLVLPNWPGSFFDTAGGARLEADQATPSARRRASEEEASVIKRRGLKKADFEAGFFFMRNFYLFCVYKNMFKALGSLG